ncbi:pyrokinin-1 receptor-like [Maniola jurtina]|uniref:pyrokinin-1 receptor-like n=1 Tax=Maniola jurtina TaxID=191418 RepID=UPI001E686CD3|nr:pyrokinin-1 receptor-like [Maniola jurtina]
MSYIDDIWNTTVNGSQVVDPTLIFGPQRDSLYIVLPITIIYSLIFITGLFGNIFTCIVIIRNKSMHTATNYYLFSLAISDLLLLVSGMPQEMYSIWSKWPYIFGNVFCVIRGLAAETSTNASVLTITLFTIERYLAICHPFVSHKMSKLSRAIKHVILLWLASFGLALPQALQFGIKIHKGVTMCLQTRVIIAHSFEISTFFFFFAPMIVITVLYSLIGLRLNKSNLNNEHQEGKNRNPRIVQKIQRKNSTQSTKRVVKMLVAVVVAFFVCWAPFHAQRLVAIYGTAENHLAKSPILLSVYYFLTYMSGVFYYMSTCINPIFYHIMSNKFREAFKSTMVNWCCRNNKRPVIQRCSYTTVPFSRHVTSNGSSVNSGNSAKTKSTIKTQMDSRNEESKALAPPPRVWKVCERCRRTFTAPTQSFELNSCSHGLNVKRNLSSQTICHLEVLRN